MKRVFAITVAALIFILAAMPVFAADKNPSPSKPDEYNVVIHNQNGGTATYTTETDKDGKHVTLVAHPKNGYKFVGWKIKGKYVLEVGDLTDEQIKILLKGDVDAYPIYKKIGSSSTTSTSISINSDTTSPKTSDTSPFYFIIAFGALFVIIGGAVGVKLAVSKKQ